MDAATSQHRWYRPTPGWLIIGLLLVEAVLWLSERLRWFPFNEHKGWTVLIAVATTAAAVIALALWFVVSLLFRWRFQFSLRSLLMFTAVAALVCSWLAVGMKQAAEQKRVLDDLAAKKVYYGTIGGRSLPSSWMLRRLPDLLGDDFFLVVDTVAISHDTDESVCGQLLEHLKGLDQLKVLHLNSPRITDVGLAHLKDLDQVDTLYLTNTRITDTGLKVITRLSRLKVLYLGNTQITDAGLEHLKGLRQLGGLVLTNTQITDAGLEHLKGLSQLNQLAIGNTRVTGAGVENLQQALPKCLISR